MNRFVKFFHELIHPHCLECHQEKLEQYEKEIEKHVCQSCESLKSQIETLRYDNQQLLNALITPKPEERPIDTSDLKPIKPRMIPWSQRRQMLETEDRERARLIKKNLAETAPPSIGPDNTPIRGPLTTDEIEKELGVTDSNKIEEDELDHATK